MKSVIIENKFYKIPIWIKWIVQESGGEWSGFDEKPLCKKPYGFWKAQGKRESYDICQGIPYEDDPDIIETHIWKFDKFLIKYKNISALRIYLQDCEERPINILKPYKPKEYKNYAWIPQTMGDQIWVLYEFDTKEEREKWEATLPESIVAWLDRDLIEHALFFGWYVRNFNGFIVE